MYKNINKQGVKMNLKDNDKIELHITPSGTFISKQENGKEVAVFVKPDKIRVVVEKEVDIAELVKSYVTGTE